MTKPFFSTCLGLVLLACGCRPEQEPEIRHIDVGVDVRLNSVVEGYSLDFVAVGQDGVIVDQFGRLSDATTEELWAVDLVFPPGAAVYFAVGDAGVAFYGEVEDEDAPLVWSPTQLGTQRNLYAIGVRATSDLKQVLVAGDDILLVHSGLDIRPPYDLWFGPEPPVGGWGQLRTVFEGPGERLWVAGDDGRLLWSDDGSVWTVDNSETSVDINAGTAWWGRAWLFGDEGTVLSAYPNEPWKPASLGTQDNILGGDPPHLIIGERTLYRMYFDDDQLRSEVVADFDWQPRAANGSYIVGDDGNVVYYNDPPYGE